MFANKFVLLLAVGCLMAQAEATFVESFKREMETVAEEITARLIAGSSELKTIMASVSTEETKKNLNDVDGCSQMFNDLEHGEKLVKDAVNMGMDTAKAFMEGINKMLTCGSLNFIEMGKCIMEKISKLKQLAAITKMGAQEIEGEFKDCGKAIKRDWLICTGKATPAPPTTKPTPSPTPAPTPAPTSVSKPAK